MPYYGEDDPRLQRARQRVAALPQDKIAFYQDALAGVPWAEEDIVRQIRLLAIGNKMKLERGRLDLKRDLGTRRLDLQAASDDLARREDMLANVFAAGGAIYGGILGHRRFKSDLQLKKRKLQLAERYNQLLQGRTIPFPE